MAPSKSCWTLSICRQDVARQSRSAKVDLVAPGTLTASLNLSIYNGLPGGPLFTHSLAGPFMINQMEIKSTTDLARTISEAFIQFLETDPRGEEDLAILVLMSKVSQSFAPETLKDIKYTDLESFVGYKGKKQARSELIKQAWKMRDGFLDQA
ncbi:hypothetical protein B0H11DRAFT_1920921 [Mycena galericulata]|nr:hypothetical protein B0H11DRAFT_1920921 [Mycena galericulata]